MTKSELIVLLTLIFIILFPNAKDSIFKNGLRIQTQIDHSLGLKKFLFNSKPTSGSILLGRVGISNIHAGENSSVLIVGPTQSGKTTSIAIPALSKFEGHVACTSVKTDLYLATHATRESLGKVFTIDPTNQTNSAKYHWSYVKQSFDLKSAQITARLMADYAQEHDNSSEDNVFWIKSASRLLAPILLAANLERCELDTVIKWINTQDIYYPLQILERANSMEAAEYLSAFLRHDVKQQSSVLLTLETILESFNLLDLGSSQLDLDEFLMPLSKNTIYLLANSYDQQNLRAYFSSILDALIKKAFSLAEKTNGTLSTRLLLLLDEAANIAAIKNLDKILSVASSYGIQILTIWQDLAQLEHKFGQRAGTILNNSRSKLIFSGLTDPYSLRLASELCGEREIIKVSESSDGKTKTKNRQPVRERRFYEDDIRRLKKGEAILLQDNLEPKKIKLLPFRSGRRNCNMKQIDYQNLNAKLLGN